MTETTRHHRCETCNSDFKNEACYKKHLNTSRHILRSSDSAFIPISCICGKVYSYQRSLNAHHKNCVQYVDSKTETENELRDKLNLYEKKQEELEAKIAMLLERNNASTTTTNTNSNNTNSNNQNITININAFGHENTDYLDEKTILSCIDRVYKSIPSLLEKLHFDPKHPENHNIKITNKKLPYASVMSNNQKWKTVDRKDAVKSMVRKGYNLLDDTYADNKKKFSSLKQQNFEGFQSKYESEDKDLVRQLKTDVEMMVLNGAGTTT